jgi:thiamine biosynthesis protein ThiI
VTSRAALDQLPNFRPTHLVVHYNEVALKGKNRGYFESHLARNIRAALACACEAKVNRLFGRLVVELGAGTSWIPAAERLSRVFGIAHVLPALRLEPDLETLKRAIGEAVAGASPSRSFAIKCRRATKEFSFKSMDVQREIGTTVQELTGWPVDLDAPELLIRIELVNRAAFVAIGRIEGPGGLPAGVAGKVVSLLSGGIDSPVAAYRLLRRGAPVTFVHFHSYPHTGSESQEKAKALVEILLPAGGAARLYLVPFAELQRRIVARSPAPLRVIVYRRFMMRAAEAIARKVGALGLVTGESLGQVASQTLENLRSIDAAVVLPVLRPLIGMDKLEIIAEAKRIGTYETSIEPHGDCCSFLMPRNPATHSTPEEVAAAEAPFEVEAEVERLVQGASVVEVGRRSRGALGTPKDSEVFCPGDPEPRPGIEPGLLSGAEDREPRPDAPATLGVSWRAAPEPDSGFQHSKKGGT